MEKGIKDTMNTGKKSHYKKRKVPLNVKSRAYRRFVTRPSNVDAFMRTLKDYVDEQAKNWSAYVDQLIGLWKSAAELINEFSDKMLTSHDLVLDKDTWLQFIEPFHVLNLLMFARLMDHLGFEEEERLRNVAEELESSWQKFFEVARMRGVFGQSNIDKIAEVRKRVQLQVFLHFTGEVPPIISKELSLDIRCLEDVAKQLNEVIQK